MRDSQERIGFDELVYITCQRLNKMLKGMIDMMGRLLDCLVTLGGENDLLYTKTSCYIQRRDIGHLKLRSGVQLSMTPEFQQHKSTRIVS